MGSLSNNLLLVIGIVFILQIVIPIFDPLFIFEPALALTEPWRFISSIFMHGGFIHLFFNCYALFAFGSILETQVRKNDYLVIFFGAGIIGGFFYYLTYLVGMIPDIPALGASGAIYGILGALAILLPSLRIYFWFIPLRMREAAMLWIVLEFLGTFDISSGIASAAHLGGLFFGLAYGYYLKKKTEGTATMQWSWQTNF